MNNNTMRAKTTLIVRNPLPECSICLCKIPTVDKCTTQCNHLFHKACINTWGRPDCPLCRQDTGLIRRVISIADLTNQFNALSSRVMVDRTNFVQDFALLYDTIYTMYLDNTTRELGRLVGNMAVLSSYAYNAFGIST